MNEQVAKMSEHEFNEFMVNKFVEEGKGNLLTPSKNAFIKFLGPIGKVGFGLIPDVPAKKPKEQGEWIEKTISEQEGIDKRTQPCSIWTRENLDENIMVCLEKDSKRILIKLNRANKAWINIFQGQIKDTKYKKKMDDLHDAILHYCESVALYLRLFPIDEKNLPEDMAHSNAENYFLDMAFRKWFSDSNYIQDLVAKMSEMKIQMGFH